MAVEILGGRRIRTGAFVPIEAIVVGQLWTNGVADVRVLAVAVVGDEVRYADAAGQVHEASGRSFQCRFFEVLGSVFPPESAVGTLPDLAPQVALQAGPLHSVADDADDEDGGAVVLGLC